MWTKKLFTFVLLFCLSVLPAAGYCSDAVYPITETELTRLDQIFNQLSSNNQQLLQQLAASKLDLETSRQQLLTYQKELEALQTQLTQLRNELGTAKTQLEAAQNSLQRANESFEQYNKEVQLQIKSLKWQRNALAIATLAAFVIKK